MRQGVICMLIAALVLQLAGGVVAGGAEPSSGRKNPGVRSPDNRWKIWPADGGSPRKTRIPGGASIRNCLSP